MAIWSLQTGSDFTSFYFPLEEDKLFFEELVKDYFEKSKPVLEKWRPLYMLRGEPMKYADFFEINGTDVIAMSQNAVDALRPFLGQIELLPIETDAGRYYASNVLSFIDCLNKEESDFIATKDGTIVSYTALEFHEEKIGNTAIFKLPELPYQVCISSDIEDQCEEDELKGLVFDPNSNMIWYVD